LPSADERTDCGNGRQAIERQTRTQKVLALARIFIGDDE
jgi:hypothetical protein